MKRLEFTYLVDLSGVEAIGAEADAYTVYTISGIRVLVNASSDEVKALPAGLYIINGKKVYIAK